MIKKKKKDRRCVGEEDPVDSNPSQSHANSHSQTHPNRKKQRIF